MQFDDNPRRRGLSEKSCFRLGILLLLSGATVAVGLASYYITKYRLLVHAPVQQEILESWFRESVWSYQAHLALSLLYLACLLLRRKLPLLVTSLALFLMVGVSAVVIPSTVNYDFVILAPSLAYELWRGRSARVRAFDCVFALLLGLLFSIVAPSRFEPSKSTPQQQAATNLRLVAEAVGGYAKANGILPGFTESVADRLVFDSPSAMPSFVRSRPGQALSLTTPVAYLTRMPKDPFQQREEFRTFAYWHGAQGRWMVISAGPDCQFNLSGEELARIGQLPDSEDKLACYAYDPTNGILSAGDIWRMNAAR